MAKDVRPILEKAESLVREGQYAYAVKALGMVDSSAVKGEPFARYSLLIGEALIKLGRLDHDHIDHAIEYYRATAENDRYAKAKFLKGWQLQSLGLNMQAKEIWLEAYAAFLKVRDLHQAAATQNRLAQLSRLQGDVEQTIQSLQKCVMRLEEAGDPIGASGIRANLALTYWRCGLLSSSLETYESIESSLSTTKLPHRLAVLLGMSAAAALSGDFKTALSQIVKLETETEGFAREHTIAYEYSGWIHLLAGKHKQAETALSKGLKLALETAPEGDLVSQIKRLFGDLYVATGKHDLAEQYAREGFAVAEKLTERLEIAACHRVFAQVEQARGNGDKARRWYAQAIDLFSQIGARYELATTRLLLGSSDLCAAGERSAMLYLAREYFESENLAHLIGQVDSHLARSAPAVVVPRSVDNVPVIVTVNPAMLKLLEFARNMAPCGMTVLLTGETGTGKDLLARYIHEYSGFTGEFVSQNVAALPATMIEAELFGHRKGAFTGADRDRQGLIKQAENGTFFLNEIGEASAELQAKLLEILETRCVRRVGDDKGRPVEFRLIAATNADLLECVHAGRFRADLFHRLNQVTLHLPPLRERPDDIAPLIMYFLKELGSEVEGHNGSLTKLSHLLAHGEWSGNVRELKSTVSRLWLVSQGNWDQMLAMAIEGYPPDEAGRFAMALAECEGNQRRAARLLGIDESTLRYHLKKRFE